LQLARASLVLQDQELKAERFLGLFYRRMSSAYAQFNAARAQREAFATQVQVRDELFRSGLKEPGSKPPITLNLLLESQRFWTEALATEYQAIVTYNNAIVGWEYAKGAIIPFAHVTLVKGPVDDPDMPSAVAYEQKRTREQVQREPALLADNALASPRSAKGDADKKQALTAPSLPALWKTFPPLREASTLPTIEQASVREDGRSDVRLTEWKSSDIFPRGK
jgi:hypothetical protein